MTDLFLMFGDSGQTRELEEKDGLFMAGMNWRVGGRRGQKRLVSCPAHACLPARNGLVNEV